MPYQLFASAAVCPVHVTPSGEVMTRLLTPPKATAAKIPSSGDQVMSTHELATASACAVHVIPSGEVMTRFVPSVDTAAKSPSSGDQAILFQLFASGAVRPVHVIPSGEVMMRFVPLCATAAKIPSSGDQAMPFHPLASGAVLVVQFNTDEVATVVEILCAKFVLYLFPVKNRLPLFCWSVPAVAKEESEVDPNVTVSLMLIFPSSFTTNHGVDEPLLLTTNVGAPVVTFSTDSCPNGVVVPTPTFPLLFITNSVLFDPSGVVLPTTNSGSMAVLVDEAWTESSPHGLLVPTPNSESESTKSDPPLGVVDAFVCPRTSVSLSMAYL